MVKPYQRESSGRQDVRELPTYALPEAPHYLRIPIATLRSWVIGRWYPTEVGEKFFRPVITLPDKKRLLLSFVNLVEAHVLDAIRRKHKIPLPKVRIAIDYLTQRFSPKHPLATKEFETDGLNLFIDKYGQLINISQAGQLAMRNILEAHLRRPLHALDLRAYFGFRETPHSVAKHRLVFGEDCQRRDRRNWRGSHRGNSLASSTTLNLLRPGVRALLAASYRL